MNLPEGITNNQSVAGSSSSISRFITKNMCSSSLHGMRPHHSSPAITDFVFLGKEVNPIN